MSTRQLTELVDTIIDDAKAAVLATVDEEGLPRLRWITPGTMADRPGYIYMVTARDFAKVAQARKNPAASMLLQTRQLDKVLNLQGSLAVLENPVVRSATLERVSSRLNAFWKTGPGDRELVVVEFGITMAILYIPQDGTREVITIDGEEEV